MYYTVQIIILRDIWNFEIDYLNNSQISSAGQYLMHVEKYNKIQSEFVHMIVLYTALSMCILKVELSRGTIVLYNRSQLPIRIHKDSAVYGFTFVYHSWRVYARSRGSSISTRNISVCLPITEMDVIDVIGAIRVAKALMPLFVHRYVQREITQRNAIVLDRGIFKLI